MKVGPVAAVSRQQAYQHAHQNIQRVMYAHINSTQRKKYGPYKKQPRPSEFVPKQQNCQKGYGKWTCRMPRKKAIAGGMLQNTGQVRNGLIVIGPQTPHTFFYQMGKQSDERR